MKYIILITLFTFLSCSKNEFYPEKNSLTHVLSMSYWSGCVQARVLKEGKTGGKHTKYCNNLVKAEKFNHNKLSMSKFVEQSVDTFTNGCTKGISNYEDNEIICEHLAIKYKKDTEEILNQ